MHGNSGVTVEGVRLKRSEAVKQAAALDHVQAHAFVGWVNTQHNIVGGDHFSQGAGRIC